MHARSITSVARSPVLQSQATANFPGPSGRATSFQPVPWQNWQFSSGIAGTSIRAREANGKVWAVWNSVKEKTKIATETQRHRVSQRRKELTQRSQRSQRKAEG